MYWVLIVIDCLLQHSIAFLLQRDQRFPVSFSSFPAMLVSFSPHRPVVWPQPAASHLLPQSRNGSDKRSPAFITHYQPLTYGSQADPAWVLLNTCQTFIISTSQIQPDLYLLTLCSIQGNNLAPNRQMFLLPTRCEPGPSGVTAVSINLNTALASSIQRNCSLLVLNKPS